MAYEQALVASELLTNGRRPPQGSSHPELDPPGLRPAETKVKRTMQVKTGGATHVVCPVMSSSKEALHHLLPDLLPVLEDLQTVGAQLTWAEYLLKAQVLNNLEITHDVKHNNDTVWWTPTGSGNGQKGLMPDKRTFQFVDKLTIIKY